MALEIGEVVEGKVTGLTKFGAFIQLPEDRSGMVHISEVSNQFVKEISDYLEKGQTVNVKILSIDDSGKIGLSIKQAGVELQPKTESSSDRPREQRDNRSRNGYGDRRNNNRAPKSPNVWKGQKKSSYAERDDLSFEEMMAKFKSESEDKLTDLKHATESKHGGFSRRGGNKRYS